MDIFEYITHIQFCDIDENNHLSQKGLIRILGEVAGIHSEEVGYGLNNIKNTHLSWMILNWKVKMFSFPQWHTKLIIKTWPRCFSKAYSLRDFKVYDDSNNLIAIASSKWILIDTNKNSLVRISPDVMNAFKINNESAFETEINDKDLEEANSQFIYNYTIQNHDLDFNHHVNNLYYIDYAYDALPNEFSNETFENIEIIYKKQLKLNDKISCYYHYNSLEKKHIISIKNAENNILHSIIRIY